MNILCIIPARGGSKGVYKKNIKLCNGKPLIAYTIEEAKKSKYIDRIIVSTDDNDIASIGKKFGAEVPFLRPDEIAGDDTPGITPIIHAINWLKDNEGYLPDYVMCLQCTSPLRKVEHIDEAIEKLINLEVDSLVSVCEVEHSPFWMKEINNGKMKDFIQTDKNNLYRRQNLPTIYRLNGAIYIAKTQKLLQIKNWYTEDTIPYIMDKISSVDIDDEIDFKFGEFLLKDRGF
ncbi:acylneuraminate cytidylyltransferase [Clostridium novyi A str. 4552]|uniref:Acylneuraminate cytidylyltransferase n=1 Tax=Clostridium novyi A str. 4552 TaxID=1444289 RepID=A0A0A0I754_CLONO|nr:acylneuraminate cytidylyltransferase family protein [Clostridium novyi]KGM96428.1 acylneuraminate cytidylyltransferase [Clostridium novyi A str. 4552]